jgi:hypothetical protein
MPDGNLAMHTHSLDLRELLKEAPAGVDLSPGPRGL